MLVHTPAGQSVGLPEVGREEIEAVVLGPLGCHLAQVGEAVQAIGQETGHQEPW